jgi:hypothetical protein
MFESSRGSYCYACNSYVRSRAPGTSLGALNISPDCRHVTPASMRLPHARGYARYTTHSLRTPECTVTYHVELWRQPLHRWLIAWAYHRYDTLMWRLPGFRLAERLVMAWKTRGGDILAVPWGANMDCRCYFLGQRGRVVLANIQIDEATYRALSRRGHAGGTTATRGEPDEQPAT